MSTNPDGPNVANPPKEDSPKQISIPIDEILLPIIKPF